MNVRALWILGFTALVISEVGAQQHVHSAKWRSPQQQTSDEAACYTRTVQQAGFDAIRMPPPQAAFAKARSECLVGRGYTVK